MGVTQEESGYGARLRELRVLAGFRVATKFAAEAGIDRQTLSNIERGIKPAGTAARRRIHEALRRHISFSEPWLVFGVGSPQGVPAALEQYLAGPLAVGIREEVRDSLRRLNWDVLECSHWSQNGIHLIRLGIEMNMSLG